DNIRYWEAQNSVRVVVDVGTEVKFTQGDAKDPDRVFIDIANARLNSMLIGKQWPVKSGLLQQIRVGQYDSSTVRVVLDVGTIGRVTSFTLRDPDRLIIDVLGKEVADASTAGYKPAASVKNGLLEESAPTAEPAKPPAKPTAIAKKKTDEPAQARPAPAVAQRPASDGDVALAKVIIPAKAPNAGPRSLIRSLGLKLSSVVI